MLSATVSAGAQNGSIVHKVKTEGAGDETPSSVVEHCAAATLSLSAFAAHARPASLGSAGAATPSLSPDAIGSPAAEKFAAASYGTAAANSSAITVIAFSSRKRRPS
jgi:hypothetical protein